MATAHRFDRAGELDQHTIARGLDHAAAVASDARFDQFSSARFDLGNRAFLVRAHQARIAGDIGSNDRDELPFDLLPERSG